MERAGWSLVLSSMVKPAWFLSLALAAPALGPSTDIEAARAALLEADEQFAAATVTQRLEGFLSFFADNATLLPKNGPVIIGKQAIREHYARIFADPDFSLTWAPFKADVAASGDLGYTVGTYEVTQGANGARQVSRGKYNMVWKKQAGGEWKVVTDIGVSEEAPGPQLPLCEPEETERPVVVVKAGPPPLCTVSGSARLPIRLRAI